MSKMQVVSVKCIECKEIDLASVLTAKKFAVKVNEQTFAHVCSGCVKSKYDIVLFFKNLNKEKRAKKAQYAKKMREKKCQQSKC